MIVGVFRNRGYLAVIGSQRWGAEKKGYKQKRVTL